MRKHILILALALCCTVSHAQWYVGGGIGLGRSYSGAALKVSKRVYLMAHLGRVGYYSVTSGGVRSTGWNSGFTRDDINVGFIFAI